MICPLDKTRLAKIYHADDVSILGKAHVQEVEIRNGWTSQFNKVKYDTRPFTGSLRQLFL